MIDIRQLPNLTIEQKDFVDRFYDQFNFAAAGSGLNRHIANVEPVLFEGGIGGEFTVYAATKLYVCLNIIVGYSTISNATVGYFQTWNENNNIFGFFQNNDILYNPVTTVINYTPNTLEIKNIYFARFICSLYNYMKFIGYRITY